MAGRLVLVNEPADISAFEKPRHFLVREKMFGRYQSVQWRGDGLDAAPDLGLAAQWQHVVVLLARSAMTVLPMTQEDLAKQMGRERQYVRDRFGGHRWLSLADAAALERLLGVRLIRPSAEIEVPVDWSDEPVDF